MLVAIIAIIGFIICGLIFLDWILSDPPEEAGFRLEMHRQIYGGHEDADGEAKNESSADHSSGGARRL